METPRPAAPRASEKTRSRWHSWFIVAIAFVALSFVVLVVVVADAVGKSGGSSSLPPAESGSANVTATSVGQSATTAGLSTPKSTPAVSAPPVQGEDTSPVSACGDILAPLDKQHQLTADCEPPDLVLLPAAISAEGQQRLRSVAAAAIQEMFAAAKTSGFVLQVNSGYRSYQEQVATYNYWVATDGRAYADRTSAKAGHSEHQMGTAADVGSSGHYLEDFSGTPEAKWVADNSWKYGFIVSYPDGKESVTGYAAEPWHVRFVGKDAATQVHASGLTLHEYLLK
jgi:zinc D-Ala-D-Ala carboxypeptidase